KAQRGRILIRDAALPEEKLCHRRKYQRALESECAFAEVNDIVVRQIPPPSGSPRLASSLCSRMCKEHLVRGPMNPPHRKLHRERIWLDSMEKLAFGLLDKQRPSHGEPI